MRLQTLLLSAFLVVATASVFRIGRSVSGSSRIVHTNARYNETIHSKPVLVYENMNSFLNRFCSNYKEVINNTKFNRGKGMLNSIAVPTCRPDLTPCPFGSDGNKLHLTGIKTNRTDVLPFRNKDNETVLISVTHEVDDVCACSLNSAHSNEESKKKKCYKIDPCKPTNGVGKDKKEILEEVYIIKQDHQDKACYDREGYITKLIL